MNYDSRAKFEGIAVQRGEFEMFSFAFPGSRCCFAVVPAIRILYQLTTHSGFGPTVARTLIRRILNLRGITHTFTILLSQKLSYVSSQRIVILLLKEVG